MKIGFIGFGKSVHRYHMPFIAATPEIEVVGYYARGRTKFEMPYPGTEEFKRFETVEQLLASEVDLIIVCTSAMHYEFSKQALEAGKHVLCEKPLCDTLAQTEELYSIANSKGLKLSPYQNRRFDHDFVEVFDAVDQGLIGSVAEIISNHTQDRFVPSNQVGTKYNGMVYGHAVHFIDQIVSRYGEPDNVIYDITNQRDKLFGGTGTIDDYYHLQLVFGNLRVGINFNAMAAKEPARFTIYGTNGTIEKYGIDSQELYLKQGRYLDDPEFGVDPEGYQTKIYHLDKTSSIHQVEHKFYNQFYDLIVDAIDHGQPMPVSEFEAKVVVNIMETIVDGRNYQKIQ